MSPWSNRLQYSVEFGWKAPWDEIGPSDEIMPSDEVGPSLLKDENERLPIVLAFVTCLNALSSINTKMERTMWAVNAKIKTVNPHRIQLDLFRELA